MIGHCIPDGGLIALCTPVPVSPQPTLEFLRNRDRLRLPIGTEEIQIVGLPVAEARNAAVYVAQAMGAEFLFFLDWDILLPPDALERLFDHAKANPDIDIFSGLYHIKIPKPTPLLFVNGEILYDYEPGKVYIHGVNGVGMGCCLIRMRLFDRLEDPWYYTTVKATEDVRFCLRGLAHTDILVDTGISCPHIDGNTGVIYPLERKHV